jgi:electron transfer flavoprotein alpha subunit
MSNVLVVAEMLEGKVRKSTHSAIHFARDVASKSSGSFSILVLGAGAAAASAELVAYGAAKIFACDDASIVGHVCELHAPTIAATAKAGGFDVIAMTASSFGKDVAPRVAAKLGAGYVPDINGVSVEGGKLVYKRPVFAGNAYATCDCSTPIQVVSVRQSEFSAAEPSGGATAIETVAIAPKDPAADRVQFVSLDAAKQERPDLGEARVIVSGGRALKERFAEVLDPLANLLSAAIGASRAACDAGYAPPELQVGQTGRVVAPQLYFAIGISGAIQHVAGMKGSKTIVCINNNPEAAIFQVADYGLVADLFVAVPALIAELKKG